MTDTCKTQWESLQSEFLPKISQMIDIANDYWHKYQVSPQNAIKNVTKRFRFGIQNNPEAHFGSIRMLAGKGRELEITKQGSLSLTKQTPEGRVELPFDDPDVLEKFKKDFSVVYAGFQLYSHGYLEELESQKQRQFSITR